MNKIKGFFEDLKSSFFGPSFYASAREKSFGVAVGFLFVSTLFVAFIIILVGLIFTAPSILSAKPEVFVEKHFPADLSIVVADGKASTNAEQPYIIPIPEDEKVKDSKFENYFVMDTRPETTVQMLQDYKSVAVLTEKSLYVNQDNGEGRMIALSEVGEDVTVDRAFVTGFIGGLMSFLWILVPIALIFCTPLFAFFMTGFYLFASIFGAVIPLLIAKLRKIPMTYGEAYKTALYATVPIMAITSTWLLLGMGAFPAFLDILLFAFLLTLNLKPPRLS
jgi:hypothetical protein